MRLRKLLQPILSHRARTPVRFELRYAPQDAEPISVGVLTFQGGRWKFQYQDEFKQYRASLHPIEGFDDLDKVYESEVLFPFFAVRIPDIDRSDVKRALDRAQMSDPDLPDLLRMFGRRALSSSAFELVPSNVNFVGPRAVHAHSDAADAADAARSPSRTVIGSLCIPTISRVMKKTRSA